MTKQNDGRENLTVKRLTDFAQIGTLYKRCLKKDFAANERKPLSAMKRLWDSGAYDCYGLYEEEERILGYAFFVRIGKNCLLDYFAIADSRRDQGLGSLFLRRLSECLADADVVLCEVEDPDKAPDGEARTLRERRLRFYQRCGYRETGLTSAVFGADYRILELPVSAAHTTEALRSAYSEIYQSMLPARFFRTQFGVSG